MLVTRLDTSGIIQNYQRTPEGFLNIFMTIARVGDLTYQRSDGTLENEYLSEQELFNKDSLASLVGKPITLDHPPEWVSSENVRKYIRGSVGHKVIQDTPFLTVLGTVHDAETIEAIESGKTRQVSAGYRARVVRGDDGKIYQQGREYNHISVVALGRAGADVRVHFDSLKNINQFENMAIQVMTHTDKLADLKAIEVAARNNYIDRLRRNDSASSGNNRTKQDKEPTSTTAKTSSSSLEDLPDDGRKAYLERLKHRKH